MLQILCAILCFLRTFNICCLAPGDLPATHRSITTLFDLFFVLFSFFFFCRCCYFCSRCSSHAGIFQVSKSQYDGIDITCSRNMYFLLISQYKAKLVRAFTENSVPLFAAGKLKTIVDSVLPMDQIQLAHEKMESNKNIGKIVVKIAAP